MKIKINKIIEVLKNPFLMTPYELNLSYWTIAIIYTAIGFIIGNELTLFMVGQ